ncbi:MAG: DNA/RNA non-specific endonuclease [Vicinamibacteria bacterium]|nr:DNA/RNA non-specific endonuclease [Vicinamibacteria bacterium]
MRAQGAWLDYEALLPPSDQRQLAGMVEFLREELPYAWFERYAQMTPHAANVLRTEVAGFEYLFDTPEELVRAGSLAAADAVQDRLVGVHGLSRVATDDRAKSKARLDGAERGPARFVDGGRDAYDRGHAMAHSFGGGLDINLVPQLASVNRRGLWRQMERYAQQNAGSYVFCACIYLGMSGHPAFIEYGVLRRDCTLWINVFRNFRSAAELGEIERLYRERQVPPRPETGTS